jgi:hypothetical protein
MLEDALEKNGPMLYSAGDVQYRPTHTKNNRNSLSCFVDKIIPMEDEHFAMLPSLSAFFFCKNSTGKFYPKNGTKAQKKSRRITLLRF